MTIHTTHPFAFSDPDPARRLRGRIGGAVTLWTAGTGVDRAGLTVSSVLVALGEEPALLGLLDPDADLTDRLRETGTAVVQLLSWRDRDLAEMFAGTAPAPGGPFRQAAFVDTPHGPRLASAGTWATVRLVGERQVGWSVEVEARLEHVEIAADGHDGPDGSDGRDGDDRSDSGDAAPLLHRRGRYRRG